MFNSMCGGNEDYWPEDDDMDKYDELDLLLSEDPEQDEACSVEVN